MMDSLNLRVLLGLSLIFLGFTLYGKWQEEHAPAIDMLPAQYEEAAQPLMPVDDSVPQASLPSQPSQPALTTTQAPEDRLIQIHTDVYDIKIDKRGGDVVYAALKQYPVSKDTPDVPYVLLDQSQDRYYIAQTGLLNQDGPDYKTSRATFLSSQKEYRLGDNDERLDVELFWKNEQGIQFKKIYTFHKSNYLVDVTYQVDNNTNEDWYGSMYGQLRRQPQKAGSKMIGMNTYQGGALYTPDKKFKKISYSDMDDERFKQVITGGWAAMVEHYFLSAWVPNKESENEYYTSASSDKRYNIGALTQLRVPANSSAQATGQLYMGPEITETLEGISPGLELTVDYGILWPISQLIFWTMKNIHSVVGNWGWSIILVTILIKLIFFKLSAASYRSMGHLRRVQPKIEQLKQRYADDKQRFSQAMMELYRKEKINPLGGCLPILVQIPVFIALYYVLLESVELRQAPFMFWIQDLSLKDPYYVLPLLMGASMLVQQKLSPAPPDPMQAKMLMIMPIVFTFLFLSFPSGLVLYWVANNVLSIAQQWIIMRNLEKEGLGRHQPKAKKA